MDLKDFNEFRDKLKKVFDDLDDYPEKKDEFIDKVIEELWKLEIIKREFVNVDESRKEGKELINRQTVLITKQGNYILEQKELIKVQKEKIKRLESELLEKTR